MQNGMRAMVAAGLTLLLGGTAYAHVSVAGPGTANSTYEATFGIGHGCEGSDTKTLRVKIPAGVTSVRPLHGGVFGYPAIEKDQAGAVTYVTWTKSAVDGPDADDKYYKLGIRLKLPDAPFTTVYFPTIQTCVSGAVTEWVGENQTESHAADAGVEAPEPAPALVVLPARSAGWNKFTVPVALKDLSIFNDAQIVWSGTAAYSNNPSTKALIGSEPNTTLLTEIPAGAEIWVKY